MGIFVGNNVWVMISDFVVVGNVLYGLFVDGIGIINFDNVCILNNGGIGVVIISGGIICFFNVVVMNNGVGFSNGGMINIFIFSSNKIMGNIGVNVGVFILIV